MKTYHIVFDGDVRLTYTPDPAAWRSMLAVLKALRARGVAYAIGRRAPTGGYIRIVRPDDSRYLYSKNPYRRTVTQARAIEAFDASAALASLKRAVGGGT